MTTSMLEHRRAPWRDVAAVRFQLLLYAFLFPVINAKWARNRLQPFRTGVSDLPRGLRRAEYGVPGPLVEVPRSRGPPTGLARALRSGLGGSPGPDGGTFPRGGGRGDSIFAVHPAGPGKSRAPQCAGGFVLHEGLCGCACAIQGGRVLPCRLPADRQDYAGLVGEVCTGKGSLDCTNPTGHGTSSKIAPDRTGGMVPVPSELFFCFRAK